MKPTHFKVTYTRTDEDEGRDYIRSIPTNLFRDMYPGFVLLAKTGDTIVMKLGPETYHVEAINGKK